MSLINRVMLSVDHLVALVEPYREKRLVRGRKIALSTLSTALFNDGKRLSSMIEDRTDISSRKLIEAFQWFSDNWPAGAEWPSNIERPAPTLPSTSVEANTGAVPGVSASRAAPADRTTGAAA